MKQLYTACQTATLLLFVVLINTNFIYSQVTLSADNSGDMYTLIESKGFGVENPDCKHPSFGPHVTSTLDNTLGKYVFVFHSHIVADDDRCTTEDRVRMEIKGGAGSPAALQHTQDQTAYYRWKFKLDANFVPSSRFCHIFQIKAFNGDDGAPLMTITPRAGSPEKMQIIHSSGAGSGNLGTVAQADLAPFKGTWVEAFVTYKSGEGSAGTFQVILKRLSDGATLLSYTNNSLDMWRTGADYNRPKWGVYRGKDPVLRDEQVRFADFCVSESSASQCPSAIVTSQTTNLPAQQDAYVRDGTNANTAFGSTDAIELVTKVSPAGQLNNNRESYLLFDISGISGNISAVSLKVFGNIEDTRDVNVPVGAYSVASTTWTESAITWNNKPATSASPLVNTTVTDATGRYYTWNLTSYVQSEKAAGHTKVSFALKNQVVTEGRLLWSSAETGSNPPQLVVTTTTSSLSAPAAAAISETTSEKIIKTGLISYPNPFTGASTISYNLADPGKTSLLVYDMQGKQVAVLVNGNLAAGQYTTRFAPGHLPAGVYTLKMIHNGNVTTKKLVKE